jgi:putative colanic acid biosynthesis acetyltransferase WcaF
MENLNINACRKSRPYSTKEYIGRFFWGLVSPLFLLVPRPCFRLRAEILRLFGAKIGKNVHIYPSAKIYIPWNLVIGDDSSIGEWTLIYNLGLVSIGSQSTISHRAHLCAGTHDYTDPNLPLVRSTIQIGSQAWICADAFVGPGVTIGRGAIVGGASVVMQDIEQWQIVSGNPAVYKKTRRLNISSGD